MKPIVRPHNLQSRLLRNVTCKAVRKIGNNPQRSQLLKELNLERLCSGDLTPDRQIGPVEVQQLPGRGRGVVVTENLPPGTLLFVSEPVGAVLHGEVGQHLLPEQLAQHWQQSVSHLTTTDRYKLSLLATANTQLNQLQAISFRDFSSDKATKKAKKASVKGFAAPANKQPNNSSSHPAAAAAVEVTTEQLHQIMLCNACCEDHVDAAVAACRGEQQHSIIGVWPECALLNHSCAPNTTAPVLVADRLLVRTATAVPAGEELTTTYLGASGGMPAEQRQDALQRGYGFVCSCHRCKAEQKATSEVSATLQAMHEWSCQHNLSSLLSMMEQNDMASLQQVQQEAQQHVQRLEQQLEQVQNQLEVSWLRASAYNTYAIMLRVGEFLSGVRDVDAAEQLADLVRVFEPVSESHLLLLLDSTVRASEASKAGGAPQTLDLRVKQFTRAITLRYGEPRDLDIVTKLASSLTAALGTHWLGVNDLCGSGRLDGILKGIAPVGADSPGIAETLAAAAEEEEATASGRQKAEMSLQELTGLQQQ